MPSDRRNRENSTYKSAVKYAGLIKVEMQSSGVVPWSEKTEPLAGCDYEKEISIKQKALERLFKENNIQLKPEKIVLSPRPRNYRTTSKRKIIEYKGKFYFLFADEDYVTKEKLFRPSLLEPDEHKIIFDYLCVKLNSPGYISLARVINYIIIRGSYTEFSVIFNIHKINAEIVKKLKNISELLKELKCNIISSFMFYDPTRSEYYFESERPEKEVTFKKFFGPDTLFLKLNDKKYSYNPTSFSQINESVVPLMIEKVKTLLMPGKAETLYDLYCGYGLFACAFAGDYANVVGIETSAESIKSAITNAKHQNPEAKVKFIVKKISGSALLQIFPEKNSGREIFLLDPPRSGVERNVIKVIAERNPEKVVHIFCNADEIINGVNEWEKYGYKAEAVLPLDMFPGSPNLETIVLFKKKLV